MNRKKHAISGMIASLLILMIGFGNAAMATPLTAKNAHCLDHMSEMVMMDEEKAPDLSVCAIHLCSALIPTSSFTSSGETVMSATVIHHGNDLRSLIHVESLHRPPNA